LQLLESMLTRGTHVSTVFQTHVFKAFYFPMLTNSIPIDLSVVKALTHSAIATKQRLRIEWIVASDLDINDENTSKEAYDDAWFRLRKCDGVVVPGGFGMRGFEGKVEAIKYARTSKTPFLGICLGMQASVVEYCRSILNRPNAHSATF